VPDLDATAKAAVAGTSLSCAWFIFLDLGGVDGPMRVTTFGADVAFSGTGDADLDGQTFVAWGGQLIDVGDVSNSESGSDTLTVTLSGIVSIDSDLMNNIGTKALWQGRIARLWFRLYDPTGTTPQGAIVSYYTGYMSSVQLKASASTQTIELSVENYLAYTTQPSNRSYLNQKDYDPADNSAAATIAAANGLKRNTGASPGGGSATVDIGVADRSNIRNL
jgi:hypothetical protein